LFQISSASEESKERPRGYAPKRDVFAKNIEETEGCLEIFVGVGTARRFKLLVGRTELKKLAIVPDIVGLREGMIPPTESKEGV
jgi:hypothetical protein